MALSPAPDPLNLPHQFRNQLSWAATVGILPITRMEGSWTREGQGPVKVTQGTRDRIECSQ